MKFVVDVILKEYGQIIIDDAIDTEDAYEKAREIWETEDVTCDEILDVEFRPHRIISENENLEYAKELINRFCQSEYGSPADFSNLEKIGIAYTTVTDEEIPVQVNVDLVHYSMDRYLGDDLLDSSKYLTLDDLIENQLKWLDFDYLVFVSNNEIAAYKEGDKE